MLKVEKCAGTEESIEEKPLLRIANLSKRYGYGCAHCAGTEVYECKICKSVWACRDVSFELYPGEILGIVGESGSGKSTLVKCIYFDEETTTGEMYLSIYKDGKVNLFEESSQHKRYIRDHLMGMVYQNPWMGLKMWITSSGNIAEKLIAADNYNVGSMRERVFKLWDKVEMPMSRVDEVPSKFSGGMQQRVQIAKALANNPPMVLLDEVTTGLDLSVQARVLDLLRRIQQELNISMIIISHDLGVIRTLADRTIVMRSGRIIENGLTDQILEDPQHPYTQLLVRSLL
jgi:putative phosphonate transport system ATP-binding protein